MLSKEAIDALRKQAQRDGMAYQRKLIEHIDALQAQLDKLQSDYTAQSLALKAAKAMQQAEAERDVLMAFADEVLEWNLESSWGSGASVSLDAIVDRYAGRLAMPASGEWRPVPVRSLQNLLCLIDPPPVSLPGNKAMVFKNPNAADVLTRISAEIRAMLSATNHATIQPLSTKE